MRTVGTLKHAIVSVNISAQVRIFGRTDDSRTERALNVTCNFLLVTVTHLAVRATISSLFQDRLVTAILPGRPAQSI